MDYNKRKEAGVEIINKDQFSPISKLPIKFTQGKNLTGSARHIRDLTADIHENTQQWNTLYLQGLTLLRNITQEKQSELYSQTLQELCDELENVCNALDDIVKNLAQLAHQINITVSLEKKINKLFTTWPSIKLGKVANLIYDAYSHEAEIKRKVFENVAHHHMDSWKMLFLATWVHQPILPENIMVLLESLLIETGHR